MNNPAWKRGRWCTLLLIGIIITATAVHGESAIAPENETISLYSHEPVQGYEQNITSIKEDDLPGDEYGNLTNTGEPGFFEDSTKSLMEESAENYTGIRELSLINETINTLIVQNETGKSPEARTLVIVQNDLARWGPLETANGTLPLSLLLMNETDAMVHDFSGDPIIFAASVGNGTLEWINTTAGKNATFIIHDPLGNLSFDPFIDQTISRYWKLGGDEYLALMLAYISETYAGNSPHIQPADLKSPHIVMIIGGESYVPMYIEAAGQANTSVTVYSSKLLPQSLDLTGYDLIFLEMFGAGIDTIEPAVEDAAILGIPIVVLHGGTYEYIGTVDMSSHPAVEVYWDNNCPENARRLIDYLSANFCGTNQTVEEPLLIPAEAIYHPDFDGLFGDLDTYLEWYDTNHGYTKEAPTVGIVFYDSHYRSGDLLADHAVMRGFEETGAQIIPVFLNYKDPHVIDRFFVKEGKPVVDVIVNIRCFRFYGSDQDPERGIAELCRYNIPIVNALVEYGRTTGEWEESTDGIIASKIGYTIAMPEMDGQTDFVMIAGRDIDPATEAIGFRPITPINGQISWLAERTLAIARLRGSANADKHVAIIYYNHGGGKNNLGASYLDIVPSLTNLLDAMKDEGYAIAGTVPGEDELLDLMLLQGRNVGTWAPGELERMVEEGDVTLLPAETYSVWFGSLPEERQQEVREMWGEPPGEIMVYQREGRQYLVIPKISFGNVLLAPQPTRGWLQDEEVLYHNTSLPPHHQYIAFYLWLRNEFGADDIIHFGRHGTHEWLPGKERGLSATDWPALLIGDCPNIYPYIMDGLGEGTQAKRRGNAVIVDHLTPPIVAAGLYGNFSALHEKIHAYGTVNETLKEEDRKSIVDLYAAIDIAGQLGTTPEEVESLSEADFATFIEGELHPYLHTLGEEFIPLGLHILGEPPGGTALVELVKAMLGEEFHDHVSGIYPNPDDLSPAHGNSTVTDALLEEVLIHGTDPAAAQQAVLGGISPAVTAGLSTAIGYRDDLAACTIEIPRLINALGGGYTPPKTGGDPVRNPYSLPTGNNFHSFDSRTMPTPEAWNTGVKMAEEMIEHYQAAHEGEYPRKTAFVLWACEAMRHEGATESEALYLLGVRPVWSKGNVKGVELIPSAELGRPRLDVVFVASGLYRDTFADKIELLDEAVRLAANAEGDMYPNYVTENSEELFRYLVAAGNNETTARSLSMARIFSEAEGAYGTGLSSAIDASSTWDDEGRLADLFISRAGFVYGADGWGIQDTGLLRENLGTVEAAVHSRSSNLYGLVDNDDCYQYFGAISLAVRSIAGRDPEMYISDLRSTDSPHTTTLSSYLNTELNARYFNPKWNQGMMEHGYAGARYFDSKFVENLWGWTVTNPNLITDSVWDRVYEVYVEDQHNLDLDGFFSENPYAYQSMIARMLETARKDYWHPDQTVLQELTREYEQSVELHGVTCCHHTCGNLALDEYRQQLVTSQSTATPVATPTGYISSGGGGGGGGISGAGSPVSPVAKATESARESPGANEGESTNASAVSGYGMDADMLPAAAESAADIVEGMVMEVVSSGDPAPGTSSTPFIPVAIVLMLIGAVIVGVYSKRE